MVEESKKMQDRMKSAEKESRRLDIFISEERSKFVCKRSGWGGGWTGS